MQWLRKLDTFNMRVTECMYECEWEEGDGKREAGQLKEGKKITRSSIHAIKLG